MPRPLFFFFYLNYGWHRLTGASWSGQHHIQLIKYEVSTSLSSKPKVLKGLWSLLKDAGESGRASVGSKAFLTVVTSAVGDSEG